MWPHDMGKVDKNAEEKCNTNTSRYRDEWMDGQIDRYIDAQIDKWTIN